MRLKDSRHSIKGPTAALSSESAFACWNRNAGTVMNLTGMQMVFVLGSGVIRGDVFVSTCLHPGGECEQEECACTHSLQAPESPDSSALESVEACPAAHQTLLQRYCSTSHWKPQAAVPSTLPAWLCCLGPMQSYSLSSRMVGLVSPSSATRITARGAVGNELGSNLCVPVHGTPGGPAATPLHG